MYYKESIETMDRAKLEALQSERLVALVKRVYENSTFYKSALDSKGVRPQDIKGIEDIGKLPFTNKSDLRDNYPFGMFSCPMSQIIRIHASSGTTGKPTVVGYTQNDINMWAECIARSLVCAGADRHSIVQVAYGYGLFTGGLGLHYGAEALGAAVIPMSGGNTEKQLMIMRDFGSTQIACTPSYAMYLGEALEASGIDRSEIRLKSGIFGAEPWSDSLRKKIEAKLGIKAYDIYGLSEIMGPGVAIECAEQNGLHVWEDNFIAEIIDPDTLQPVPDGVEGELVVTTITKEGIPLLRYRTRDISKITREKCACGRTHARIARIKARTDDMLIIRGVNVIPSQIESVLLTIDAVAPHYAIIVTREGTLDMIEVQVELNEKVDFDKISSLENVAKTIADKLHSVLGINAKIKLVEPHSISRFEGKASRVVDKRKEL
jgi:phenylacetate-CoA ligase